MQEKSAQTRTRHR